MASCECGSTVQPYRHKDLTWCIVCGRAFSMEGKRVPSNDMNKNHPIVMYQEDPDKEDYDAEDYQD